MIEEQNFLDICKNNPSESYNQIYTAGGGGDFSPETFEKMRRNHADYCGKNNPRYGIPMSDETKRKIGISNSINYSNPTKTPMYGKHHSQETKLKIGLARVGKYSGKNSPSFDSTPISLINIRTNERLTATKYDLITTMKFDRSHLWKLLCGRLKTYRGWVPYNPSS